MQFPSHINAVRTVNIYISDTQLPAPPFLLSNRNSYLSLRFSRNCSIVTSSSRTKSDLPNSRPSSSAIPATKHASEKRRGKRRRAQRGRKRRAVDSWGLCRRSAVGVVSSLVDSRVCLVKSQRAAVTSCSTSSCQSARGLMHICINSRGLSLKALSTSASSRASLPATRPTNFRSVTKQSVTLTTRIVFLLLGLVSSQCLFLL